MFRTNISAPTYLNLFIFVSMCAQSRYGGLEDSKLGESTEDSRDDSDVGGGYGYRGESKGGEEKGSW